MCILNILALCIYCLTCENFLLVSSLFSTSSKMPKANKGKAASLKNLAKGRLIKMVKDEQIQQNNWDACMEMARRAYDELCIILFPELANKKYEIGSRTGYTIPETIAYTEPDDNDPEKLCIWFIWSRVNGVSHMINVLVHEMAHMSVWDQEVGEGHGPEWQARIKEAVQDWPYVDPPLT